MTKYEPIDLSIIDAKEFEKIKGKKKRANRVLQVIRDNGLDKDRAFMDEINPLIQELLKEYVDE